MASIHQIERSNPDWLSREGQVWIAWTVFNPHGPTLCCIGGSTEGADRKKGSYEIFFRWMHMLGGASFVLGHVDEGDASFKATFLGLMLNAFTASALPGARSAPIVPGVPSCISLSQMPSEQKLFFRDLFKYAPVVRQADWGRERYYLLKYKLDLFARSGEEAREGYEEALRKPENKVGAGAEWMKMLWARYAGIPSFLDWEANAYESQPYEEDGFDEWWEAITSPAYLGAALPQFAHAWAGAAYCSGAQIPVKEQFEDVRDFMARMNHPLWPSDWTTARLVKSVEAGGSGIRL